MLATGNCVESNIFGRTIVISIYITFLLNIISFGCTVCWPVMMSAKLKLKELEQRLAKM